MRSKATARKRKLQPGESASNVENKKPLLSNAQTLSSKEASLENKDESNQEAKCSSELSDVKENVCSYWLMKSEPESRVCDGHEMKFGIDDLKASKDQTTWWDGVRNYEARNKMKSMKLGQQAFFYHSNCKNPGLVGLMNVCKESYVDHTQFDPEDAHYDQTSKPKNPKWYMVDVKFERDLKRFIPLTELKHYHLLHKNDAGPLAKLSLFTRSRLSVQSISKEEWDFILDLENKPAIE